MRSRRVPSLLLGLSLLTYVVSLFLPSLTVQYVSDWSGEWITLGPMIGLELQIRGFTSIMVWARALLLGDTWPLDAMSWVEGGLYSLNLAVLLVPALWKSSHRALQGLLVVLALGVATAVAWSVGWLPSTGTSDEYWSLGLGYWMWLSSIGGLALAAAARVAYRTAQDRRWTTRAGGRPSETSLRRRAMNETLRGLAEDARNVRLVLDPGPPFDDEVQTLAWNWVAKLQTANEATVAALADVGLSVGALEAEFRAAMVGPQDDPLDPLDAALRLDAMLRRFVARVTAVHNERPVFR